jgi:serpin B
MAAGGASGSTKNAMLNTLRLSNVPTGEIRNSHNSLLQQLLKGADADVTINIADSIWTDNRTLVQPTFISQNQKLYDAEIRSADFSKASTVNSINDWVSNKTRGRIRTIIDHLEPASKLVILNAVYFKGGWYSPFEQKETKQKEFTLLSGNKKKLPMMEDTRYTYYMKGKDFQALRLPYGSGARFDMWLFLPDEKPGSFRAPWQRSIEKMYEDFLNDITQSDWSSITGAFASERVHIVLPRFKVEMAKTVGDNLKSMGMNIAFDKEKANFSEMISLGPHDQAWIEEVLHKTFIEVNEKGTEAAAATGVIMGVNTCGTIKEPPPPKEFIADHPFVLGIRDSSTGAILFLGSIADPG